MAGVAARIIQASHHTGDDRIHAFADLFHRGGGFGLGPQLAQEVRARQQAWLAQSDPVTREMVAAYSLPRRLWQNLLAMSSPLL